jgi:hypothetical protein
LNGQYKVFAVLTLKEAKSKKYNLASVIAYIVAVVAHAPSSNISNYSKG